MKKKILVFTVILCIFAVTQAHSFGLGAQFNFYTETGESMMYAPGFSLLISPNRTFHIAANYYIDPGNSSIIGLTLDAVPISFRIAGSAMTLVATPGAWSLNFTLGLGAFFNIKFDELFNFQEEVNVIGGLRVPIGVNFLLGQNFEVFTHVAPSFGVNFVPSLEFSNFFFPVALGARIWFK